MMSWIGTLTCTALLITLTASAPTSPESNAEPELTTQGISDVTSPHLLPLHQASTSQVLQELPTTDRTEVTSQAQNNSVTEEAVTAIYKSHSEDGSSPLPVVEDLSSSSSLPITEVSSNSPLPVAEEATSSTHLPVVEDEASSTPLPVDEISTSSSLRPVAEDVTLSTVLPSAEGVSSDVHSLPPSYMSELNSDAYSPPSDTTSPHSDVSFPPSEAPLNAYSSSSENIAISEAAKSDTNNLVTESAASSPSSATNSDASYSKNDASSDPSNLGNDSNFEASLLVTQAASTEADLSHTEDVGLLNNSINEATNKTEDDLEPWEKENDIVDPLPIAIGSTSTQQQEQDNSHLPTSSVASLEQEITSDSWTVPSPTIHLPAVDALFIEEGGWKPIEYNSHITSTISDIDPTSQRDDIASTSVQFGHDDFSTSIQPIYNAGTISTGITSNPHFYETGSTIGQLSDEITSQTTLLLTNPEEELDSTAYSSKPQDDDDTSMTRSPQEEDFSSHSHYQPTPHSNLLPSSHDITTANSAFAYELEEQSSTQRSEGTNEDHVPLAQHNEYSSPGINDEISTSESSTQEAEAQTAVQYFNVDKGSQTNYVDLSNQDTIAPPSTTVVTLFSSLGQKKYGFISTSSPQTESEQPLPSSTESDCSDDNESGESENVDRFSSPSPLEVSSQVASITDESSTFLPAESYNGVAPVEESLNNGEFIEITAGPSSSEKSIIKEELTTITASQEQSSDSNYNGQTEPGKRNHDEITTASKGYDATEQQSTQHQQNDITTAPILAQESHTHFYESISTSQPHDGGVSQTADASLEDSSIRSEDFSTSQQQRDATTANYFDDITTSEIIQDGEIHKNLESSSVASELSSSAAPWDYSSAIPAVEEYTTASFISYDPALTTLIPADLGSTTLRPLVGKAEDEDEVLHPTVQTFKDDELAPTKAPTTIPTEPEPETTKAPTTIPPEMEPTTTPKTVTPEIVLSRIRVYQDYKATLGCPTGHKIQVLNAVYGCPTRRCWIAVSDRVGDLCNGYNKCLFPASSRFLRAGTPCSRGAVNDILLVTHQCVRSNFAFF